MLNSREQSLGNRGTQTGTGRRGRYVGGEAGRLCMFTECGNRLQYLEPSTKWKTQLTEMIFREVGQDALVYLVLAEYSPPS